MAKQDAWTFSATVVRVVDGDTVELDFEHDAGFSDWIKRRRSFRILGINAPEKNTPAGRLAWQFLQDLLPVGSKLNLTSVKLDKYTTVTGARYDAVLTRADGHSIAEILVQAGHAVPWDGTGKRPTE